MEGGVGGGLELVETEGTLRVEEPSLDDAHAPAPPREHEHLTVM